MGDAMHRPVCMRRVGAMQCIARFVSYWKWSDFNMTDKKKLDEEEIRIGILRILEHQ